MCRLCNSPRELLARWSGGFQSSPNSIILNSEYERQYRAVFSILHCFESAKRTWPARNPVIQHDSYPYPFLRPQHGLLYLRLNPKDPGKLRSRLLSNSCRSRQSHYHKSFQVQTICSTPSRRFIYCSLDFDWSIDWHSDRLRLTSNSRCTATDAEKQFSLFYAFRWDYSW